MDPLRFLSEDQVRALEQEFGSPLYVYDQKLLEEAAREVLAFPNPFGLTARYAMKALPTAAIIQTLVEAGLHIDASSGFEAERALAAGVPAEKIQITAQELPEDLESLVRKGVLFNACSLHQLGVFGERFAGSALSVRINPGLGSGHNNRTNVGGTSSSFGIWHEHLGTVLDVVDTFDLKLTGMHTHIGSGGDPEVWKRCARLSLGIAERLPAVERLSLGGGFKVGRMPGEVSANLKEIGEAVRVDVEEFADKHGRKLHLEIEPGTFLVANAGAIIAQVIDVVDTGEEGHSFVKLNTGMTELMRPALYGAQHPIHIVAREPGGEQPVGDYLVAGHCCESGDILTPEPGNPEGLAPRSLARPRIDDLAVVEGAGAYASGLAGKNYNSFPEAAEVMVTRDGGFRLIRRRQSLDQMLANEVR